MKTLFQMDWPQLYINSNGVLMDKETNQRAFVDSDQPKRFYSIDHAERWLKEMDYRGS